MSETKQLFLSPSEVKSFAVTASDMLKKGASRDEICKKYGIGKTTYYKYLKLGGVDITKLNDQPKVSTASVAVSSIAKDKIKTDASAQKQKYPKFTVAGNAPAEYGTANVSIDKTVLDRFEKFKKENWQYTDSAILGRLLSEALEKYGY